MKFVIASEKTWHAEMLQQLEQKLPQHSWQLISQKEDLKEEVLRTIAPDKVFIPHWSYIIPSSVYDNFECIVFHMTDLPYGRGGSPLQNLIVRGQKETLVSALRVQKGIDEGPVYLKKPLSLDGTARDIFMRCATIIGEMIEEIIELQLQPLLQEGEPVLFKRRTPAESNISKLEDIQDVFDYIRMLDADGYPHAFLETEYLRFEFTSPTLKENQTLLANVRITKK